MTWGGHLLIAWSDIKVQSQTWTFILASFQHLNPTIFWPRIMKFPTCCQWLLLGPYWFFPKIWKVEQGQKFKLLSQVDSPPKDSLLAFISELEKDWQTVKLDALQFHSRDIKLNFHKSFNAWLLNKLTHASKSMHDLSLLGLLFISLTSWLLSKITMI